MPMSLTFTGGRTSARRPRVENLNRLFKAHGLGSITEEELANEPHEMSSLLEQAATSWLSQDSSWTEVHSSGGIRVRTQLPYTFKTEAEMLAIDPDDLVNWLSKPEQRQSWDDSMEWRRTLKRIDASTSIVHVRMKTIWPLSARDAVLICKHQRLSNNAFVIMARSAKDGEGGEAWEGDDDTGDDVRMHVWMAVEMAIPTSDQSVRLLQLFKADPRGYLPPTVVQKAIAAFIPNTIDRLLQRLREASSLVLEPEDLEGQLLMLLRRVEKIEQQISKLSEATQYSTWSTSLLRNFLTPVVLGSATFFFVWQFFWIPRQQRQHQ